MVKKYAPKRPSVIRLARQKKMYNQDELADLLNVSRTTVSDWEQRKTKPSVHNLIQLSIHLEIDLNELMDEFKEEGK